MKFTRVSVYTALLYLSIHVPDAPGNNLDTLRVQGVAGIRANYSERTREDKYWYLL